MSFPGIPEAELEALRRAYAALLAPGSPACPPPEALASGILGELGEEERLRLGDHVVGCRRCGDDWRLLAETHDASTASLRHDGSSRGRGARRALLAAAAVLIAAAAGLLLLSRNGPGGREAMRSASRSETPDTASPRPGSRLSGAPAELSWRVSAATGRQRARLYDAAGRLVWESGPLGEARATLPEFVRARLVDGDYFWTVELETADGMAKLGPFPFAIARR